MINRLTRKTAFAIFLTASFYLGTSVFAQSNQAVQGNIINQISASSENGVAVLIIKGILDPKQLTDMVDIRKGSGNKFTVSIPNALIDPEKITEPFQKFSRQTPLVSVQILENIREKGDDVVFTVDLIVEARKNLLPEVVKPITASTLKISFKDPEQLQQQREDVRKKEAEMQEEELEVKAREMATKKRQEEDVKKQKAQELAKLSVDEILKHFRRPSIMQISIINASGWAKRAYKLSIFLGKLKKKQIEESLGIKMDIINISTAKNDLHPRSTLYYRQNFLKHTLFLADLIHGEQVIIQMNKQKERQGIDIEIFLGKDFK